MEIIVEVLEVFLAFSYFSGISSSLARSFPFCYLLSELVVCGHLHDCLSDNALRSKELVLLHLTVRSSLLNFKERKVENEATTIAGGRMVLGWCLDVGNW